MRTELHFMISVVFTINFVRTVIAKMTNQIRDRPCLAFFLTFSFSAGQTGFSADNLSRLR